MPSRLFAGMQAPYPVSHALHTLNQVTDCTGVMCFVSSSLCFLPLCGGCCISRFVLLHLCAGLFPSCSFFSCASVCAVCCVLLSFVHFFVPVRVFPCVCFLPMCCFRCVCCVCMLCCALNFLSYRRLAAAQPHTNTPNINTPTTQHNDSLLLPLSEAHTEWHVTQPQHTYSVQPASGFATTGAGGLWWWCCWPLLSAVTDGTVRAYLSPHTVSC